MLNEGGRYYCKNPSGGWECSSFYYRIRQFGVVEVKMELSSAVRNMLKKNKVGYISVQTPSGGVSTNSVSYYFDEGYIYFLTSRAAKQPLFIAKAED